MIFHTRWHSPKSPFRSVQKVHRDLHNQGFQHCNLMHVAEANLCIMASSSSQSSTDVKDQNCFLLSLPVYLREKILVFAITIPDGIYPRQRDKFPETFTYTYADR